MGIVIILVHLYMCMLADWFAKVTMTNEKFEEKIGEFSPVSKAEERVKKMMMIATMNSEARVRLGTVQLLRFVLFYHF